MTIEISKLNLTEASKLPCYDEVQGQETTTHIYVDIGSKEMWVSSKLPWDNGISPREANGYVRTFRIPNNLTAQGYNDLLDHSNLAQLAELMSDEAHEYYDGNNYKMSLSDKGVSAEEAIEHLCDSIEHGDYQSLEPVCAYWYLTDSSYEALMENGGTHEDVAERIVQEAHRDGYHLSATDVEKRLREMKEALED